MAPKRPPPEPDNPYATVVVGGGGPGPEDEDLVGTAERQVAGDDEGAGATAFVRVDRDPGRGGALPPPRRKAEEKPSAPKQGLQVSLPDDEPGPEPKPKPKLVTREEPRGKGRRGAWWDEPTKKVADEDMQPETTPAEEEPPPEEPPPADEPEHDGSTAMVRLEEPAPDEPEHDGSTAMVGAGRNPNRGDDEPEVVGPKRPAGPEVYRPVPADDYGGHLQAGPPRWRRWLRRALVSSAVALVLGTAALVAGYLYIARQVPAIESLHDYKPFLAARVVTADGTQVGQFFREKRTLVKMDQVPRVLVQAVLSAEDKDFYRHPGINLLALLRAAVVDLVSGHKRLGASTITQQVVKNLGSYEARHGMVAAWDKKLTRKLKELVLAWRLERDLSKDDILFLYLNQINFGKAHYGVEEASLYYFGKHVQDLELGEAALLAGLPQNPTRLNPRRHPANAKRRQRYVLDRLLANRLISREEHDREVEKPLALPPLPADPPGAWYLEEVRRQLVGQFGEAAVDTAGWTVEVAMDPRLQAAAENAAQEGLRAVDKRQGWRGALFKVERTQLNEFVNALGRRLQQVTPPEGAALVFDLEGVAEKDRGSLEAIATAAHVRELVAGGVYAGVVTSVRPQEARVLLAAGVEGPVPFSSMGWARPFRPEAHSQAPGAAGDVVAVGDVVPVRVAHLQLVRTSASAVRPRQIDFTLEQTPLVQGAFAALDARTRGVLALVGGFDMVQSQFNRATQAKRQPGSAFKPFLYAAAIESAKYTAISPVDDSPEVITDPWSGKPWKPQNFEKDEFAGRIPLRRALAESKNTVAVKLLLALGLDTVRAQAVKAGLSSSIPQSYTAALGTGEVGVLELINAYATLAAQGQRTDPVFIRKVVSREGGTLFKNDAAAEQKMRPDTAYVVVDLLRSVIDDPDGTAHSLSALGRPASGKTGTASEHRDAWFVGFTPSLVAGAWVGFDDHRMLGPLETGGHCAGPIWLQWMRAALAGQPIEEFPAPPPGVVAVRVNRNTGELAAPDDPFGRREVFLAGTEPTMDQASPGPSQEQFYQEQQ